MKVTLADVLDFLVSRSMAPSSMGAQLDKMKFGIDITPDPFRARTEAEDEMLSKATLIRCVDQFGSKTSLVNCKTIEKVHKASLVPRGAIALNVLRSFHEWRDRGEERALVAIYRYLATIAPNFVPPPPDDTPDLHQAFREGKARRARTLSAEAYADAFLALTDHVKLWNKRS